MGHLYSPSDRLSTGKVIGGNLEGMKVIIAWDGDHIGREVGRASLADDVEGLRRISQAIDAGNRAMKAWVENGGGSVVSFGGDEGRAEILAEKLTELPTIRRQYASAVGSSVSIGVGTKLSEADRALMAAKIQGGDRIVLYTPEVDQLLEKVKAEQGEKTESDKLAEQYLNKAERPFKASAFRHRATGAIYETGPYHSIDPWLQGGAANHELTGPHNSSDWEAGFVTHDGTFMNREQAAAHVKAPARRHPVTGAQRQSLDSQDPEAGFNKALPPDWNQPGGDRQDVGTGSDEGRASGFFWPAAIHKPTGSIHLNSEGFHGSSCTENDDCKALEAKDPGARSWGRSHEWIHGFVMHPKHRAAHGGKVFYTREQALHVLEEKKSPVLHPKWDPNKPGAMKGALSNEGEITTKAEKVGGNEGAHAGFSGASKPSTPTIQKPKGEASEHTQGEAAQAAADNAPDAPEATNSADQFEGQFHDAAMAQDAKDKGQASTPAQDQMKVQIVEVLKQLKAQMPILEQVKQSAPDTYQAVMGLAQAVIMMARQMNGDDPNQQGVQETTDRAASQAQIEVPLPPEEQESKEGDGKKDDTKKAEITAEQEDEKIAKSRKTPEAQKPHDFRPAVWTHPNGHPRCRLCGDEERTGGRCAGAAHDGLKKAFPMDPSKPAGSHLAPEHRSQIRSRALPSEKVPRLVPAAPFSSPLEVASIGSRIKAANQFRQGKALQVMNPGQEPSPHQQEIVQAVRGMPTEMHVATLDAMGAVPEEVPPDLARIDPKVMREPAEPGSRYSVQGDAHSHNIQSTVAAGMAPTAHGPFFQPEQADPWDKTRGMADGFTYADASKNHEQHWWKDVAAGAGINKKAKNPEDNWHNCDDHGHCWGDGETAEHCLICGMTSAEHAEELEKATLLANKAPPQRHHLMLPVGSKKDPGPGGSREVGKIKVTHKETDKDGWISARAGQVLSQDGHAISARNPSGK